MDDAANTMKVIKTNQYLLGHSTNQRDGNAFVIIAFHDFEKVDTQYLKYHDEMLAIRPIIHKAIQEHNIVAVITNRAMFELLWIVFVIV